MAHWHKAYKAILKTVTRKRDKRIQEYKKNCHLKQLI